jgi:hypothetical protein
MSDQERQFNKVLQLISESKENVYRTINTQLIDLYWSVGAFLSRMVKEEAWGKSVVSRLSTYLNLKDSTLKGFSMQNLWRMKQFFDYYEDQEKLSPLSLPENYRTSTVKYLTSL